MAHAVACRAHEIIGLITRQDLLAETVEERLSLPGQFNTDGSYGAGMRGGGMGPDVSTTTINGAKGLLGRPSSPSGISSGRHSPSGGVLHRGGGNAAGGAYYFGQQRQAVRSGSGTVVASGSGTGAAFGGLKRTQSLDRDASTSAPTTPRARASVWAAAAEAAAVGPSAVRASAAASLTFGSLAPSPSGTDGPADRKSVV